MERDRIIERLRLQLITQKKSLPDILTEVQAFLDGGGRWVQLRMKEAAHPDIVQTGKLILPLCRKYGAVFILNDHPELALEIGADGVHIGKNDISPVQARNMLGWDKIIGCTANTFEDIEQLSGYPIDYIGLGPFRFTSTKKNLSPVLGVEGYRRIFAQMQEHGIRIPVTVIGGITWADVGPLNEAGACCYAVSGSISNAADPTEETERFLAAVGSRTQGV